MTRTKNARRLRARPGDVVLVVEDDEDAATLVRMGFAQVAGARAVFAKDGRQALALLGLAPGPRRLPRRPDLVILDLDLPKVGGLQVLQAIQADPRSRDIPVVVFTATTAPDRLQAALTAHARECVPKPTDPQAFLAAVDAIWRRWGPSRGR